MTTQFALYNSTQTITAPSNAVPGTIDGYVWGPGGNGGLSAHGTRSGGGGGAAGFGGEAPWAGITPGSTSITLTLPAGGAATAATIAASGATTITANPGTNASGATAGSGGAASGNSIARAGGNGATGINGATTNGAGGGGSGGSTGAGGAASTSTGGSAGTGGTDGGQSLAGTAGASGAGTSNPGANGLGPGSGASGGGSVGALNLAGGTGGGSQALLVWTVLVESLINYAAMTYTMATAKKAVSGFKLYSSFTFAPLPVDVINQWTGTFAQPSSFGPMPPALQSTVIALTPSTSTGLGSGVPSPGSWLFCVTGMTQQSAASGFTVGCSDDIHSFWRPGDPVTSTWAVSPKTAKTRTSVWYTANLPRQPGDVYAAPNGCMAGMAVTVFEVAGLSPWDVVTGIATGYAAAATSLNLALGVPSGPAFILAAATGDLTTATQALTPGSPWHTLTTVSASNGTDHSCDAVLTTAYLSTTSGSVSINATAGSATDLSGVIIGVQVTAASPVPAGANPAWPGRFILEFAPGGGFETPADELTWVTLNDNGVPATQATRRLWSWHDRGGVPYALGQLQSGEGDVALDNADGNLTPSNSASPYFPDVVTGTPIRLRCAIGTLADRNGSATANRWYTVQRNILDIPEKRNEAWRNFVEMSLTDIWSVVAGSPPSPWRAEVLQDMRGVTAWWWPMDDQPQSGGVLPTSLRNAAPGNSTALQIIPNPGGVSSQDAYSTTGTDLTSQVGSFGSAVPAPGIASYNVGQLSGWMYGDPQSGPASSTAGGPVTASPGAAAWQQSGLLGNTGAAGWALIATDTFPPLASGATVVGWYNYGFAGGSAGCSLGSSFFNVAAQPVCPLTLCELATGSNPVAILQLDTSGHLSLVTYNGATPTSHAIYSGSDLRASGFFMYSVRLTQSTWEVRVNAGLTADVSGSATISASAWSWIVANGDLGSNGGTSIGTGLVHGGNVAISHLIILPGLLPAYRELSWYQAAITGFGVLPAPSGLQLSAVANQTQGGGSVPDGSEFQGLYGFVSSTVVDAYTFSAVASSVAGSYTSGPSARATIAGIGQSSISPHIGAAVWAGWSALAPLVQVFTAANADAETEAASCLGAGDSFTTGYGSGASGHGVCQVSGGTGANPPTGPSALGDTVAWRVERIAGYAGVTAPNRSVDATANAPVEAALDVGGAAAGSGIQNVQQSDDGLLAVDNGGALMYRSRPHLNADPVIWQVSSAGPQFGIPFKPDQQFMQDPQRVYNAIDLTPYSPDGATLPVITPANAAAVAASQAQYGPRPLAVTSYLQSESSQQTQANWLLSTFGANQRRIPTLTVDASGYPPAWLLVMGANIGDRLQVTDQPLLGGPMSVGIYRISSLSRKIAYGANGSKPEASITLVIDPDITFWS